jgi:hypothetical protein
VRIFGREPSVIIGFIGTVLTALAGLHIGFLNAGQATAIVAALTAVFIALTTRPLAPGLYTAAITVVVALFTEYGLNISESWVTAITSITLGVFAFFGIRPQVTPRVDPQPTPTVVI